MLFLRKKGIHHYHITPVTPPYTIAPPTQTFFTAPNYFLILPTLNNYLLSTCPSQPPFYKQEKKSENISVRIVRNMLSFEILVCWDETDKRKIWSFKCSSSLWLFSDIKYFVWFIYYLMVLWQAIATQNKEHARQLLHTIPNLPKAIFQVMIFWFLYCKILHDHLSFGVVDNRISALVIYSLV